MAVFLPENRKDAVGIGKQGGFQMRRNLVLGLLAVLAASSSGCFVNQYSADPIRRYRQLFFQSQDLALIEDDWELFWMLDQPSQLSELRYNGLGAPQARTRMP